MTKKELYDYLTSKNPHWKTEGANLTATGLKKLIETAHNEGFKEAYKYKSSEKKSDYDNLFDQVFGGKS